MRTEQEMMDVILGIARADDRIRAVYMNGSRTNPSVPTDVYQDYDIVFSVTETASFIADKDWLFRFGNPLIVQEPDWNDAQVGISNQPHDFTRRYAWLMLFDDGNRIDLTIVISDEAAVHYLDDKLTLLLLDKDNLLPAVPPPSDEDYRIKKPTDNGYKACCNEFWWCLNNVAKGIARDELPYVMEMLNHYVRDMLNGMVEWFIGLQTDFAVSAGKMGKYFIKYLPPELYARYAATYSGSDYADIWASVETMCGLFHTLAVAVAAHFGFTYRQDEEDGSRAYLRMVRDLEAKGK
jgi:aminoglycoside 6-adenylyltransferase